MLVSWVLRCVAAVVIGVLAGDAARAQPVKKETDADILKKLEPFIAAAVKPDTADTPHRKLQKDRARERAIALVRFRNAIDLGFWAPGDFNECVALPTVLSNNLLELIDKPEGRLKCHEYRVEFLKHMYTFTDTRVLVGSDASQSRDIARAALLAAEIDLLKFKETK